MAARGRARTTRSPPRREKAVQEELEEGDMPGWCHLAMDWRQFWLLETKNLSAEYCEVGLMD